MKRHLENIIDKLGVRNRFIFAARKTHPRSSDISPLRLKAEPGETLREHKAVVAALNKLVSAAKKRKLPELARFPEKLMLHAQTEDEVVYPAC